MSNPEYALISLRSGRKARLAKRQGHFYLRRLAVSKRDAAGNVPQSPKEVCIGGVETTSTRIVNPLATLLTDCENALRPTIRRRRWK